MTHLTTCFVVVTLMCPNASLTKTEQELMQDKAVVFVTVHQHLKNKEINK